MQKFKSTVVEGRVEDASLLHLKLLGDRVAEAHDEPALHLALRGSGGRMRSCGRSAPWIGAAGKPFARKAAARSRARVSTTGSTMYPAALASTRKWVA